jgi:hypothetical protein
VKNSKEEEKVHQLGPDGLAKDISIVYCIDVSGSMSGSRLEAVKKTILG